jgi:hypothetical protein
MSCTQQTTKTYKTRPSPPFKAPDCPGQTRKGNDGIMYESREAANGKYRWFKKGTKNPKKKKNDTISHLSSDLRRLMIMKTYINEIDSPLELMNLQTLIDQRMNTLLNE